VDANLYPPIPWGLASHIFKVPFVLCGRGLLTFALKAIEILHLNETFEPVFLDANPYPWPYNGNLRLDNTALIIIDMQKDFADPNGYFLKVFI
jgi:hypothetical protein